MRALIFKSLFIIATVAVLAIPVRSEEGAAINNNLGVTGNKNECLLVAKNCAADSIQERIDRIANEIRRGTDVYTKEELKALENELNDARKSLEYMETNGGA